MSATTLRIGVIGSGKAHPKWDAWAYALGQQIAQVPALLVCGGLSGVMAQAAAGAKSAGGQTLGILPGETTEAANASIDVPIPTGLGEARNLIVVQASDALIAVGGGAGTLSEIGFALKLKKPIVLLGSWQIQLPEGAEPMFLPEQVESPEEAMNKIMELWNG